MTDTCTPEFTWTECLWAAPLLIGYEARARMTSEKEAQEITTITTTRLVSSPKAVPKSRGVAAKRRPAPPLLSTNMLHLEIVPTSTPKNISRNINENTPTDISGNTTDNTPETIPTAPSAEPEPEQKPEAERVDSAVEVTDIPLKPTPKVPSTNQTSHTSVSTETETTVFSVCTQADDIQPTPPTFSLPSWAIMAVITLLVLALTSKAIEGLAGTAVPVYAGMAVEAVGRWWMGVMAVGKEWGRGVADEVGRVGILYVADAEIWWRGVKELGCEWGEWAATEGRDIVAEKVEKGMRVCGEWVKWGGVWVQAGIELGWRMAEDKVFMLLGGTLFMLAIILREIP
ncbi:hypothetical protein SpCBS45565_g07760 [Spizellomyces sp. 'palustris']|nr:hypothetical protein SpCBS45565_g07760 [Spizellomyces sp. 'palustris']